ncbi:MAG: sulfatase-like hydrolase/transferase, partial [Clostridia bacterium]|nr:sulfatase-like hydrolase/transferase [Clostridia bacterium]
LLLALWAGGRFRKRLPRLSAALALALGCTALVPVYTSGRIYDQKTQNNSLIYEWSESQVYFSKGFVYPFLHSVRYALHPAPDGYSASAAKNALAAYTDETIAEDKRVNIVCIMLEAYCDFSKFDELTFTTDVYEKYHELEAIGYSGKLITDIFAGDTRISEREFLTGMPYARLDSFVAPSNSYVWYLQKNGYVTTGSHPCYAWFYNRRNINKNLGFESYLFSENYYKELTGGDITYDARLFPIMRDLYLAHDKDKPYFSFSITYQGHGPYESGNAYFEAPFVQQNAGVTDAAATILNNYLHSIYGTTEQLYAFAQEMLATKEPLVLVFFGDHKPWLGNNGSVYASYGIDMDITTEKGFDNYYSTQYLILANDAAKAVTGNDFRGEGEALSVSFLMNKVFALCGYKGNAYMQFTSDIMQKAPVIHRTDDLSEGEKHLYDCVSYYYRKNFAYN